MNIVDKICVGAGIAGVVTGIGLGVLRDHEVKANTPPPVKPAIVAHVDSLKTLSMPSYDLGVLLTEQSDQDPAAVAAKLSQTAAGLSTLAQALGDTAYINAHARYAAAFVSARETATQDSPLTLYALACVAAGVASIAYGNREKRALQGPA